MSKKEKNYQTTWSNLSWEVSAAIESYFALIGNLDWHNESLENRKKHDTVALSPYLGSIILISNALVTYFFIAACRIREKNNRGDLNLPKLLSIAKEQNLLSKEDENVADNLINQTKPVYEKLKKVRGMVIAHLQESQSPFQILQKEGTSRKDILVYLERCHELFWLLGKPCEGKFEYNFHSYYSPRATEIKKLLDIISPH